MTYPRGTLGEHVNFSNGKTSPERDLEGEFPVYGSNGLIGFSDLTNSPAHTSVIGRVGSYCGSIHFSKEPCWVTDNAIKATAKTENESRFWYYAMSCQDLHDLRSGSGQPLINQTALKAVELPVPSPIERLEIASILGALDDKIELNRRMSATLEEMARSLYRSWFVDFDPVHAKMEGRQPAFMDEATAALFPERLGEDGLPEGWARQAIGAHFHALKGLSYKGGGLCTKSEGLPLHNLNSVLEGGGYKYAGIKYYSGDFKERHIVRPGDLIVANTEQGFEHMLIGHSAIIPRNFGPMGLFSHHLFKVEPNNLSWLSREWLYLTLSVSPAGTVVRSFSNGTTVNMLPADALELPQIIVPTEAVASRFDELIKPWFERRDEAIVQTETLAALRDSLLPKLMSGELRVGDARNQIEEVA